MTDMTQPVWGEDGSLLPPPAPDEDRSHLLHEYLVTFEDEDGGDAGDYTFMAEDEEHAREQAMNAEPDLKVASIELLADDEEGSQAGSDEDDTDYTEILTPQEIRDGGAYRKDEKGKRYWLNMPQLAEFTRMDDSFTEEQDKEFWSWFSSFIEANKLKPDASYTPPKQKRGLTAPQWSDYWDKGKEKTKKYLSDWWGGSSYYHYGSSDQSRKLAVALQAVQSTIRVVDNGVKRMRVQFSRDDGGAPQSFTAYDERLISVSPMAMLDKKLDEGEAIDITTGMALHEASHAEYSEATLPALQKPTELTPLAVAGAIHNLFEDIRIEQLTGREFPGFVGYFDKKNAYLWPFVKEHAPEQWEGLNLQGKVNAIIAGVKWSVQFADYEAKDPDLATEMQWWRDMSNAYASGAVDMRYALEMAMARLREDEQTAQEMEQQAKAEKDAQARGEMEMPFKNLPEAVKQAIQKMAAEHGGTISICSSPGQSTDPGGTPKDDPSKSTIKASVGEEVSNLVDAEFQQEDASSLKIPELGNKSPKFISLHPLENTESKAAWTPPLRGLVHRMRNAFHFRPVAQQWTTRLQRTGSLDEDEVWRAAPALGKDRDFRVFETKNVESSPDTTVTLLLDISGSMSGKKVRTAVQAAAVMHEVLKTTPGVRVRVRAHTGDVTPGSYGDCVIYKVWENGEPMSRLGIPLVSPMGNNYDGYAIGWCVREMLRHQRPEEQRLLIVLSDGLPHGMGYGGEEAMRHVKETQLWARRQGVDVVQVAIDPEMDPRRQAKMFDHFVPFTTLEALPGQLTTILKKAIK